MRLPEEIQCSMTPWRPLSGGGVLGMGEAAELAAWKVAEDKLVYRLNYGDLSSYTCLECMRANGAADLNEYTSPAFWPAAAEGQEGREETMRWVAAHTRLHARMWAWAEMRRAVDGGR